MIRPVFYFYLLNKHKIINYLTYKKQEPLKYYKPIIIKPLFNLNMPKIKF